MSIQREEIPKLNELVLNYDNENPNLIPPTRSPISISGKGKMIEFEGKGQLQRPSIISMNDYEDEEHEFNRNQFNNHEKDKIMEWMKMLNLSLPKGMSLYKNVVDEFRDGLLLCDLVEVLEGMKIENIQRKPKSNASCLLNIKKALQVLKKKNVKFTNLISHSKFLCI